MRFIIALALLVAIPSFAVAQQPADPVEDAPIIELQQTTPDRATETAAPEIAPDVQTQQEATEAPAADDVADMQDPATKQWLYLVGAIVVAGIILAVIL